MGLFGKDKTRVVDGAIGLVKNIRVMVDDSTFTQEEKARFDKETSNSASQFVKDTLGESTERSRTRRTVAVDTVRFFFALIVFLIITWKFDSLWFVAVKDMIIEFKLPIAFIMIMAFFFGGHYLRNVSWFNGKSNNPK